MKSTTLFLASLLATSTLAQPHRQHKNMHQHAQHKQRDLDIVWVTETDWVTDVVGVTTTVWVSSGFVPPTAATTEPSSTTATSTTTQSAAQFFQGAASSSASSTSVYVAPVHTPSSLAYVAPVEALTPVTTSTTPAYVAPVVESSPSSTLVQVYTQPVASTSVYSAPAPTTSTAAASAATTAASSSSSSGSYPSTGSTSGTCEGSGSACQGDITYYTAGLGACGETTDGDSESVIALPHDFMGTQSNGNPFCGKTVTIYSIATGKTTQATVVDKCMGCTGRSIDLSIKAMAALDPDYETVGRETATWWFNE